MNEDDGCKGMHMPGISFLLGKHCFLMMVFFSNTFYLYMVIDIDECEVEPSPCDSEKEVCSNLVGTYVCKCKEGLVKGEDGKCVTEEERDRQVGERTMKNQKKKKKKKKKSKKGKVEGDVGEEEMRQHYSWYYALAPLTSSYLVYKYWKPNLVTSMGIILFICVSSTLSPDALSRM